MNSDITPSGHAKQTQSASLRHSLLEDNQLASDQAEALTYREKAKNLRWVERLINNTPVLIRPIRLEDAYLERKFFEQLSPEFQRYRFLGIVKPFTPQLLQELTDIDHRSDMTLIALIHRDGKYQEIGVSRYALCPDQKRCECAVTVSSAWRRQGLGTLLMRRLIEVARARGVARMYSIDAAICENAHSLAHILGFRRISDPEDPITMVYELVL